MEGALVLGVTNLDLLGALVVVDKMKAKSPSRYDELRAREKLTELLGALAVPRSGARITTMPLH